ncbi:DNA translocase FtsK [Tenacibaculum finnmarkense]|uniref:DNA translocase FtsK n=1 Tax=Tenacibaculum finnmarkense TaxID=2781243 RepID=UPI00187B7A82|nr:DNA translocase FtsK [Tenacibaculum finnmarkense]MBE7660561.1 DNA translocase FtsK [Tenacibaculum finnmarkense genomovar finnmarkense]MCG8252249.1 DNA translocase FtsK [Tenacibaculum finnmarkense genomovar finnmarkense]MCG8815729.1 DNA translocase FtsK [Tenacibaculum finnmarkense]MCG8821006.1 DNA translocase FtsK [Tenacibaculum finnmarkense]
MAKRKTPNLKKQPRDNSFIKLASFFLIKHNLTILGAFLVLFSIFLTVAFISFFFCWQEDQSTLSEFSNRAIVTQNLLGKIGAKLSNFFVYKGFGLGSFVIPVALFLTGARILLQTNLRKIITSWNWGLLSMIWIAVALGFSSAQNAVLPGVIGFELNAYFQAFLGKAGVVILLLFFLVAYLIIRFKITPEKINERIKIAKENQLKEAQIKEAQINEAAIAAEKERILNTQKRPETPVNNKTQHKTPRVVEDLQETPDPVFELPIENLHPNTTFSNEIIYQEEDHISLDTLPVNESLISDELADKAAIKEALINEHLIDRSSINKTLKNEPLIEKQPIVDQAIIEEEKAPIQQDIPIKKPVIEKPEIAAIITKEPVKEEAPIQEDTAIIKPIVEKPIIKEFILEKPSEEKIEEPIAEEIEVSVEKHVEEKSVTENLSDALLKDFGEFDPTLDLGHFKFPTLDLLKQYNEVISIDADELEANKNRIVTTLQNYKIGISDIKATVGPTITLYEIVPNAGVRISKIKNLEDDIALSLSALGIRIIAPIPGKGTIGIEVPNQKSTIVSMHSAIASQKFQDSEMELPIALGKTIANETLVVDLAKMPHLLMAGATGQGKSVGLNAVLTSLLYKKHPAEVKFVLVDPKKVELTLFNKIERHYLAKLPDSEEAIITDTTKVVHTLNSLCMEMDARYDLLKNAMVRNIKEYNVKFKARKLNPENGHKFLPYIVLVIDEFADLIMTAGKEVETPIARLAQLARAIGIHLIVATQRPSVNVITGIIKANFPARIAFRVTSKIDSRTILDAPGADQLIGRGDMLYSGGNELIRVQCAFVDTPEVEKITDFIGSQRAYPSAYLLPEYVGEESGTNVDVDIADRDKLFKNAAEVIITAQQGSASLLQRKLKLGYNRAGRIIDQLEAAGIVGPFEGSKARMVLVPDFIALEQLLENEKK